ncbi:unnamed protein product [Durusdinium trenchii]|uniref:Pentatricopeptide repeat-containing protein n=1 Tax=Durusdinium trenchii TaxID=1381693 RepID=A0ABP0J0M8_9DINO
MEQALLQGTAAVAEAAKQGRLEEALRRLALLRDRGLRLDAAVHHAALGGAKRRWREALQMAIQMQQDGISFTSVTFTCAQIAGTRRTKYVKFNISLQRIVLCICLTSFIIFPKCHTRDTGLA